MINDEALAKALGGVMSNAVAFEKNSTSTLTANRGNVMAYVVLTGFVHDGGAESKFSGCTMAKRAGRKDRGWDPVEDGGVRLGLIEFVWLFLVCRRASRCIAMDIVGAPVDLLRRVPSAVIKAVHATLADLLEDSASGSGAGCSEEPGADSPAAENGVHVGVHVGALDSWASEGEDSSDGDVGSILGAVDDDIRASRPYEPPATERDEEVPLMVHTEKFSEPALADTGGASGKRVSSLFLPVRASTPSTTSASLKVVDVLRAVVVNPFTVWGPRDNW